jgi:hypothetical protein
MEGPSGKEESIGIFQDSTKTCRALLHRFDSIFWRGNRIGPMLAMLTIDSALSRERTMQEPAHLESPRAQALGRGQDASDRIHRFQSIADFETSLTQLAEMEARPAAAKGG